MPIQQMLSQIREKRKLSKDHIVVGFLDDTVVAFLRQKRVVIHSRDIYLTHKGLSHLSRESKNKRGAGLNDEDILNIPEILQKGNVYFDAKGRMNILYCQSSCQKYIKIVVDTSAYDKKLGSITLVKTAGYIVEANLKAYEKIK